MDDADLVKTVAADFARQSGRRAIPYLRDQGEIAANQGDAFSAEAWHDIADAVALILSAQTETLPESAASLAMIGMAGENLLGAVELLQEHAAHQEVRPGQRAQR